jgi:two-component system NtrC family sensor kinase
MLLETAVVAALVLISFLLDRASPEAWLKRWNVAWLLYLVHLPLSFLVDAGTYHPETVMLMVMALALASNTGLTVAATFLAGKEKWERRIWMAGGVLLLVGLIPALRLPAVYVMTFAAIPFALIHALSRRTPGSWLLLAAFSVHLIRFQAPPTMPLHLLDTLRASFLLVAGLLVFLEQLREGRRWRGAALRFSAAMAAGGGAPEVDRLCREIGAVSGAALVRVLEDDPLDPIKKRSAILSGGGGNHAALLRSMKDLRGLVATPLKTGGQLVGSLCLGFQRRLPGPPVSHELLQEVCDQIATTLRGSQLTAHLTRTHREWLNTVDSIQDFILVHDSECRIERVNRPLAQTTGLLPEQLVGHHCREVLSGAGENWKDCPFCEGSNSGEEFNSDFGGYFLVSTARNEETAVVSVMHVARDVSARKAAEDRYRYIFENVREGVFISTPDGRLLDCNDGLARMLGYPREELLRAHIPALWAEADDRRRQTEEMERQGYVEDYEVRLRKKNGEIIVGQETSFARRNSTGKTVSYQGFLVDVTERKKAEQELRRQNDILSEVNSLASRMTHRLDRQQVLSTVVEEIRRMFGFDMVAIYMVDETTIISTRVAAAGYQTETGRNVPPFHAMPAVVEKLRGGKLGPIFPASALGTMAPELRAIQKAEGTKSVYVMPLFDENLLGTISLANRTERQLSEAEQNLLGAIGRQVNNVLSDILLYEQAKKAYQDLQLAQEQLLQSQKLAAVGQLVSGVAHELNNPLAAIIGYAQLLESHVTPKGADYLGKLMRQAKRTQKIIQDLLTFSRQRKPERTVLDLNAVVEGALMLRDFDIRAHHVQVERLLTPGLPTVLGDRHQLEQAFLNIIQNACDAILEAAPTGTLEVRTYLSKEGPTQKGPQVILEFLDDGVGMKDPNRVFEPFYTTKKVGMGTGLGLSICYGILKEHGGEIEAESRSPRGATFRVRMPAMESVAAADANSGSLEHGGH